MNQIILLMCIGLLLLGCTQTPSGSVRDVISGLQSIPSDFCVSYGGSAFGSSLLGPMMPGDDGSSLMEYCVKGSDVMSHVKFAGMDDYAYCLRSQNKFYHCSGWGANPYCEEDTSICDSIQAPFEGMQINEADLNGFQIAPSRSIAGFTAKCLIGKPNLDTMPAQPIPSFDPHLEICYHPVYKYPLYVDLDGRVTQLDEFKMPAPVEKFEPIAPVQTLEIPLPDWYDKIK